jgi:large subunit ribosomal protein L54
VARIASSVPAGTVLKGLNFMKNKQDPVAMEDHEYPDWLWEVLAEKKEAASSKGADAEGDLFCKSDWMGDIGRKKCEQRG